MPAQSFAVYPSLQGRTVLVTGGAAGIGEAIVRNFAAQKSRVAFIDVAADLGEKLAEELDGQGGEVRFFHCDLRDIEALKETLAAAAAALGPIRVLVNNAAHDQRHDWREVTPEYWDERIAVNLKHVFFAIQAVAPGMIEAGGGAIVNFGSTSWMISEGNMPAYTTSKAGIHGMTRSLGRDLGKHNIRINTVVPGWVMTKRQLELWVNEEGEKRMDQNQTLAGRIQPDDLARMVLFLSADDSRMCSGHNFFVDAGWA